MRAVAHGERCVTRFPLIDTALDPDDRYERERELWRVLIDHITQGMPLASAYHPGHDRSDPVRTESPRKVIGGTSQ